MVVITRASTIQRKENSKVPSVHDIFHASGGRDEEKKKERSCDYGEVVLAVVVVVLLIPLLLHAHGYSFVDCLSSASETNDSNNLRSINNVNSNVNSITKSNADSNTENSKSQDTTTASSVDWSTFDFGTCQGMTITEIPKTSTWKTKPLWIAGYPRSGAGSEGWSGIDRILPPIIQQLTSREVRKFEYKQGCLTADSANPVEVVGCTTSFPRDKDAKPLKRQPSFNLHTVILTVRNIATAIPAAQHQNVFHGRSNLQVTKNEWIEFRDHWVANPETIAKWRESIIWWTSMKAYFDGYFIVPYEHLFHDEKGPELVMKLARVLQRQGFDIVPENEIPCIWYNTIQEERKKQEAFYQYIPKYRKSQVELFERSLKTLIGVPGQHPDVVSIYKEYKDSLERYPPVE